MEADAHGRAFSENGHKKTTVRVHRGLVVINVIVYIWPIGQLVAFFNSFADAFFDNLGWIV